MELWDAYLADGTPANRDLVRGEPIPTGLYHMVSEILVRHVDGDFLIMQRDFRKLKHGGCFEITGGSALKGEDKVTCAKRELLEETGIKATSLEEIGHFRSDNTHYFEFFCLTDCDKTAIRCQEGETIAYRWLTEAEFADFVNLGDMIPSQKLRFTAFLQKAGYIKEEEP